MAVLHEGKCTQTLQLIIFFFFFLECAGNILILRGNIEIQPPTRRTVSYEFLSQLVAEYLLTSSPGVDISAALSIMPYTQSESSFSLVSGSSN
jgi:hypothetical protein